LLGTVLNRAEAMAKGSAAVHTRAQCRHGFTNNHHFWVVAWRTYVICCAADGAVQCSPMESQVPLAPAPCFALLLSLLSDRTVSSPARLPLWTGKKIRMARQLARLPKYIGPISSAIEGISIDFDGI
jgi:hypothetical protein